MAWSLPEVAARAWDTAWTPNFDFYCICNRTSNCKLDMSLAQGLDIAWRFFSLNFILMYEAITVHVIEDHKQKSHMKVPVELNITFLLSDIDHLCIIHSLIS